jgi:hypothetical protein
VRVPGFPMPALSYILILRTNGLDWPAATKLYRNRALAARVDAPRNPALDAHPALWTAKPGVSESGVQMIKRTRRNHTPAFRANGALAAMKGDKTLEPAPQYNVRRNQNGRWRSGLCREARLAMVAPLEYDAGFAVAPEPDGEFAGESYEHEPPDARRLIARLRCVPARERADICAGARRLRSARVLHGWRRPWRFPGSHRRARQGVRRAPVAQRQIRGGVAESLRQHQRNPRLPRRLPDPL